MMQHRHWRKACYLSLTDDAMHILHIALESKIMELITFATSFNVLQTSACLGADWLLANLQFDCVILLPVITKE
jgi:hypothetical protein